MSMRGRSRFGCGPGVDPPGRLFSWIVPVGRRLVPGDGWHRAWRVRRAGRPSAGAGGGGLAREKIRRRRMAGAVRGIAGYIRESSGGVPVVPGDVAA